MQNFTLGKKGITMLLFGLVLLTTSFSSFGQENCPTVSNTTPPPFCYLATVSDLVATANGDTVRWYRTATSTNPIPNNELLVDGIYFAGNQSGTCLTRIAVNVAVNTPVAPTQTTAGATFDPCQFSVGETNTVAEIIARFEPLAGYDIEVFAEEFGTTVLGSGDILTAEASYYVGQRDPDASPSCPSLRVAIRYSPILALAPTGDATPPPFCEGATVADLEASGINRWYSTATSQPALADSTPLINGESYYASQIVNRNNSSNLPCESLYRFEVTVTVTTLDAGPDSTDNPICQADLDARLAGGESGQAIFLSLLGERSQLEGTTVILDPTIAVLGAQYQTNPIQTFTTTATFTTEEGCEDEVVISLKVNESYDAGDDNITGNEVCRVNFSEIATEQEVEDYLISLLSVDFDDINGSFSADDVTTIVTALNTGNGAGTFNSTYTVGADTACEDTATLEFTVLESPEFELVPVAALCNDDIPALVNEIPEDVEALFLENFGDNIPEGEFEEGDIQAVINQYNQKNIDTFTVTYIVNADNTCTERVELSRTVIEGEVANAGAFDNIENVCTNEEPIVLTELTNNDPEATKGGTFTGEGVTNNIFDPSTVEPDTYTITYRVDESINCVEGVQETFFTIEVVQGPISATVNREFCVAEANELIANENATFLFLNGLVEETGVEDIDPSGFDLQDVAEAKRLSEFLDEPTDDSETFTFTYTDESNTSCADGIIKINITITPVQQAEVDIADFDVCSSDDPLNLFTYLDVSGGTFSYGTIVIENGLIDISTLGTLPEITYSVNEDIDTTDCIEGSASTTFTVEVVQGANAGAPKSESICNTQVNSLFGTNTANRVRAYYIGLLESNEIDKNGTFDPTIQTLINRYNQDNFQDFTTTYTVSAGNCKDSVELNITVLQPESTPVVADAGPSFCLANNPTVGDLVVTGNNITWYEDVALTTVANNTDLLVSSDYYAVSMSKDEKTCNSFATKVIVSVVDDAPAPEADTTPTFCSANKTVADLDISGDNITVYEDAALTIEALNSDLLVNGDYYAVAFCGTESTKITVTIGEKPEAPVANNPNPSFCLINNPTVGDIVVTGDNVAFYTDAELTNPVDSTTPLRSDNEDGTDYFAVAKNDAGTCTSDAIVIKVKITDPNAPTLQLDGNEFCRSDNPTLQDLLDNINGSGIKVYSSLTGGTALPPTTVLQNDVQYFATATDATLGCESSERLAIRVEVAFCGIPEGFSPNGDNVNDRFVIPDIATEFPNYNIEVFNRWGNVVFKGNASTPDWDGISNQSGTLGDGVLPVGVYFYILNYNDGATTPIQGKLYLSR
jgi:gliding motility-associated-like protein